MGDRPVNPALLDGVITRIRFRNARSWRSLRIDPHPGLNVITGESDCGKSNIVRNLRSLLENDSREAIQFSPPDGQPSSIAVGFGHALRHVFSGYVMLIKGDKQNEYIVSTFGPAGREDYKAVGSSVPDGVREALNMGEVDLGGDTVMLSVAQQRGASFAVDESPAAVARAVGAVSGLDVLYLAVAEGEKRRRDAERRAKDARASLHEAKLRARVVLRASDPARAGLHLSRARAIEGRVRDWLSRASTISSLAFEARSTLSGLAHHQNRAKAVQSSLRTLSTRAAQAASDRDAVLTLSRARDAAQAAQADLKARIEALSTSRAELARVEAEVKSALAAAGACPLCGSICAGPKGHHHANP